jgi:cytochrome b
MKTILVWDWPLRVFHWALVLLVIVSVVSGQIGGNWMVWHERAGIAIAGLLAFRLVWGFIGSTHARFFNFIHGPRTIVAYMRGQWRGLGHNPLGALSVVGLLAVMAFQVGSGLVGNDDIAFNGPLYPLVDKQTSDVLIGWHKASFWLLVALVAAHLAAIAFYTLVRKERLVGPMITGRKATSDPEARPAEGGGPLALALAVSAGIAVGWIAAGGLLPPPPPPPPDVGF